jgi:hypothetical protein
LAVTNEQGHTGKVKSWDVMRRLWRSVTGARGGNFDEAKRKARWSDHRKPIKGADNIAAYIGGYVAKDMELVGFNRKRYSHSEGITLPETLRTMFRAEDVTMRGLLQLAMSAVGDKIGRLWFDKERSVFFVATADGPS